MKMISRLTPLSLFLILSLILSACAAAPAPVSESGDASSDSSESSDGPGIFTWAYTVDPADLDPRSNYDGAGLGVLGQMYEALTYYGPLDEEEELSPWLATSWESNEDGTEWTFNLREGVKFHDGTDFNADAVKYTIESVKNGELATSWLYAPIEEIEVVDDYTIKFVNGYPAALDLIFSSAFGAWMMSPTTTEGKDQEWYNQGNSAGTGPYKIASREPGTRIVLEAHEEYWQGWDDSKFKTVVFEIIEDETVREQMIRAGDAQVVDDMIPDNFASLDEDPSVEVKAEDSFVNYYVVLNFAKEQLQDLKVRQALALSFPYETVLANANGGLGTAPSGMVPQSMWGANPDIGVTQDLDAARTLLDEAGVEEMTLEYWVLEGQPLYEEFAQLWRPELEKIGITLNLTTIEFNAAVEKSQNDPANAHDVLGFGWFPTYVTPFDVLFSPYFTGEYFNLGFYDNEEFNNLILDADGLTASDRETAISMFQEAGKMLVDDVAALYVMDGPRVWVMEEGLQGYSFAAAYNDILPIYDLHR
ncbi:MAG: ABC transporter substrate-binding protein [Chloroflexota bacterium]